MMKSQITAYLKAAKIDSVGSKKGPEAAPRKRSDDQTPREQRGLLPPGKRIAKRQNDNSREEGEVVSDKTNSRKF